MVEGGVEGREEGRRVGGWHPSNQSYAISCVGFKTSFLYLVTKQKVTQQSRDLPEYDTRAGVKPTTFYPCVPRLANRSLPSTAFTVI